MNASSTVITVGTGTCGVAAGADKVLAEIRRQVAARGLDRVAVRETGCVGMCYSEVLVEVADGQHKTLYGHITPDRIGRLLEQHVQQGKPVEEWRILTDDRDGPEAAFLKRQKRIVLRNCGHIDPLSLDDYLARDGYKAIQKVVKEMTPEQVIDLVQASGLRGRGGAGFPTGTKWRFARQSPGTEKYVVCNADEGDPGAFMDRSVCEGDPHSVIEGMMICGYAIGATHGYIYCRAEYPKAIVHLRRAIDELKARQMLGTNLFGSSFSFDLKIKEGAGAFVCGEETALIASIEGKRGMPRLRPPYPAVRGLWGKPTNINNVETLATIPWIILNGAAALASLGTEKSKGTKVFAMAGKVKRSGLVEVPMGITINQIIFDVCGGIIGDRAFKAVQMGGPSGGCIPASLGDTLIDYEQINQTGAIMGSGGMVVMDDTTCMVEMARFFLEFTQNESCGKCTSCRIGTLRMLEILERIVEGQGKPDDIPALLELGEHIKATALCGLGQTAPNPVLTTLKYFREEYEAHIHQKRCPAHSCPKLVEYVIRADKCVGCTVCARECPTRAISGKVKMKHVIDSQKCVKCGKCLTVCRFDAVAKE
ncbi:MAG: NADH dehydrogenase, NuoF-like subunit [Candidatus Ozemobacter sibiricus]|uniref:NADH dehydrogenase, NuoF-like subunit n=1 Tax=Candidatus Ozemobacter sibiricus TaxID=2268124 RepID=A0A367ZT11_9BACT|nr:MAG: NADH dehydrogenase, NuoF-like subunit [Candidatus Ozemobacter sibiricus]